MELTDTQLMEIWNDFVKLPKDDISREARFWDIQSHWNEILQRKKDGYLTDKSKIDPVKKSVIELAKFHKIPVRVKYLLFEENNVGTKTYPNWTVQVMYGGNRKFFVFDKWDRIVNSISDELSRLKLVVGDTWVEGWDYDRNQVKYRKVPDSAYENPREIPRDEDLRFVAEWIVDTTVWNGPDEIFR